MLLTFGKKIGSIDLKVLKTLSKIVLFKKKNAFMFFIKPD